MRLNTIGYFTVAVVCACSAAFHQQMLWVCWLLIMRILWSESFNSFVLKLTNYACILLRHWQMTCDVGMKKFISFSLFSDIQARWQWPVHEPQARAGGGAVRLPVYAETLRRKTDRCEVPCWQSHWTRLIFCLLQLFLFSIFNIISPIRCTHCMLIR